MAYMGIPGRALILRNSDLTQMEILKPTLMTKTYYRRTTCKGLYKKMEHEMDKML